jgi:hypothetical protein
MDTQQIRPVGSKKARSPERFLTSIGDQRPGKVKLNFGIMHGGSLHSIYEPHHHASAIARATPAASSWASTCSAPARACW